MTQKKFVVLIVKKDFNKEIVLPKEVYSNKVQIIHGSEVGIFGPFEKGSIIVVLEDLAERLLKAFPEYFAKLNIKT